MKIADAFVLITKDDSPLRRGLASTKKDIEGWTNSVSGIIKQALGFSLGQAFTARVQGILDSLRQLSKGLIGGNADFEQYETRFKVLLGSMDAAKERIADLAEFGATTPFDLPGVVEADTILQAFGFHAEETAARFGFSGEQIRTIAGDVASGAGASFQEIALNLGKFSSGATGEAIMRFQEMGIVTRDTLRQMGIEFSKSGELVSPVDEAMTAILNVMQQKYGGMMQAQSSTFSGMMSNLRDWVGNAQRFLGQPTFELVKGELADLLSFLNSGAVSNALSGLRDLFAAMATGVIGTVRGLGGGVIGAFEGMFGETDQAMQGFSDNAFGWGSNIAISFAEGIYAAAVAVIDALSYLGKLITYWLIPGSPPKLLPNLDRWGQGAADAWLEGWTQADMSAFDTLAGMVEQALNSLDLDEAGVIDALLGAREGIKAAINEINQMGDISQTTLEMITRSAGNLAGPIGEYVQSLAEVARRTREVEAAQERVNQVNEKYDAILDEQNARLMAIRDKEQAFSNEKERARMQEILASATAGEREKEQARLALERLDIEEEIAQTEKAKNKELSAAEKQLKDAQDGLDMAKERLDLSQSYIDQLTEENDLLKRQRELLAEIAEEAGGGGGGKGAGAKGGAGAPKVPGAPKPGGPSIFDRLKEGLFGGEGGDDITSRMQDLMGRFQDIFKPLEKKGEDLGEIWKNLGQSFKDYVYKPIQDFLDTDTGQFLVDVLENIAKIVGGAILINGVIKFGSALLGLFSPIVILIVALGVLYTLLSDETIWEPWQGNADQLGMIFDQMYEKAGETLGGWSQKNQEFLAGVDGWFAELFFIFVFGFVTLFAQAWAIVQAGWQVLVDGWKAFWDGLTLTHATFGAALITGWNALWTGVSLTAQAIWTTIKTTVATKASELRTAIETTITTVKNWLEMTWGNIRAKADEIWTTIKTNVTDKVTEAKNNITTKISELKTEWGTRWTEIKTKALEMLQALIDALPDKLTTLAGDIKTSIDNLITDLLAKVADWKSIGGDFIQGIIDGAAGMAQSLIDTVVSIVTDAVGAAADAIYSHSPSRLTRDVLGKPMGQGVMVGWEESMQNAQKQMADTLVNAIPAPAMVGAGGYGDIHETYNFYGDRDLNVAMQGIRDANARRRFQGGMQRR